MTLNVTPGTGAALKSNLDGGEHVVVHSEDATQRAALLAALAAIDPDAGLAAIVAKLIATPATEAKQDVVIGHVDGIETLLTNLLAQLRPATSHVAITPGASAIAGGPVRRLVIGGAGNITVTANGVSVQYAVVAGQQLDVAATHVTAATATGIVGQF